MFSFLRNWRKAKGLSEMFLRRLLWNGSIMIYPRWSSPMPDPDLEITGVGGGGGGVMVSKRIFWVLQASVWSKNRGCGPPLDPPLISKFQKAPHDNNKHKKYCFARALVFKDKLRCRSSEVK